MTDRSADEVIAELRRASALVDESPDTASYQMRMMALAMIAREFLRRLTPDVEASLLELDRRASK